MLQLRQLNLKFALASARALSEYVQNQRCSVENLAIENFLQISALGGRQFVIENDSIDALALAVLCEFLSFARTDKGPGDRRLEFLRAITDNFAAGCRGQFGQFVQGFVDLPFAASFEFDPD